MYGIRDNRSDALLSPIKMHPKKLIEKKKKGGGDEVP